MSISRIPVLITGGSGVPGKTVAKCLVARGWPCIVLELRSLLKARATAVGPSCIAKMLDTSSRFMETGQRGVFNIFCGRTLRMRVLVGLIQQLCNRSVDVLAVAR